MQVLVNLIFVVYGSLMYALQRLCFGPLRPTEIEQLYEKGWFAVTETCLAMTIFRDEVGAFFLVMFTALVTGKVWGWIGDGRVEVLEQQPPANPLLFHARLSLSLFISVAYDIWLLTYAVDAVVQEARPTMMVMFLFEFAVLTVTSLHTVARYVMSLVEQRVIKTQTHQRLEGRRRQIREQRAEILRRREAERATDENEELPDENDVDEMDIEVPGWEAKGQWVLSLDLVADFIKFGIYTAFFCVLMSFYGLPIHIMRDWFMTTRSFLKRLHALIRYRQALKHMEQYPDATAEELGREDTCIICREEMRPWDPADASHVERSRAKRLPCGHILHFGCLKSWLERQQVCPTCRRPVARDGQQPVANGPAGVLGLFPAGQNRPLQPPANGQAALGGGGQPAQAGPAANNANPNVRMFNLGPIRLGFAQGGADEIREMAQRMRAPPDAVNPPVPTPTVPTPQENNVGLNPDLDQLRGQLLALGNQVRQELVNTQNTAHEILVLSHLLNEIARLRQLQQQPPQGQQQPTQLTQPTASGALLGGQPPLQQHQQQALIHPFMLPAMQGPLQVPNSPHLVAARHPPSVTRHVGTGYGAAIPAGSSELPDGVVIPPGWSLLPLQRFDGETQPSEPAHHTQGVAQDMLRSVFAHHPRSRGTSPAPSSTLSTQVGRAAAPTSNAAEASRRPGSQGGTSSDTATRRQPPVAAPIPLTPNWGGPAQLFGGDRAPAPMFGYQVEPRQGPHGEPGEGGGDGSAANASMVVNGVASGERSGDQRTEGAADVNGSSGDRRPRPVTVEEADDAEDER
jgi:E3 ubiquitin-protein ligase synoviolin